MESGALEPASSPEIFPVQLASLTCFYCMGILVQCSIETLPGRVQNQLDTACLIVARFRRAGRNNKQFLLFLFNVILWDCLFLSELPIHCNHPIDLDLLLCTIVIHAPRSVNHLVAFWIKTSILCTEYSCPLSNYTVALYCFLEAPLESVTWCHLTSRRRINTVVSIQSISLIPEGVSTSQVIDITI